MRLIIVDDGSPDGTGDVVDGLAQETGRIQVIHRPTKLGLGTAYVDGLTLGMSLGGDFFIEMDADGTHDPGSLPALIAAAAKADVVIGSRYLRGVSVINWSPKRILLSWLANHCVRFLTRVPLSDCTSGYRLYRRAALERIGLDSIRSQGYAFQIEMAVRAHQRGLRMAEVPVVLHERHGGESKVSFGILLEALLISCWLALSQLQRSRKCDDCEPNQSKHA